MRSTHERNYASKHGIVRIVAIAILSAFVLGFFIKVITGVDDVLTRVPVIAAITRTRMGKIAFSSGAVTAVMTATLIAYFFSSFLESIPSYRYIIVLLIFLLAGLIFFDGFVHKPRTKAEHKLQQMQTISTERFIKLYITGFAASFATILDDVIAFFPVFLLERHLVIVGILGILVATLCQAILVIYFADKIAKIPYKEEIAAAGLVILGTGVLLGWV